MTEFSCWDLRLEHIAPKRAISVDRGNADLACPRRMFFAHPCEDELLHLIHSTQGNLLSRLQVTGRASQKCVAPATDKHMSIRFSLRSILNCPTNALSWVATDAKSVAAFCNS